MYIYIFIYLCINYINVYCLKDIRKTENNKRSTVKKLIIIRFFLKTKCCLCGTKKCNFFIMNPLLFVD